MREQESIFQSPHQGLLYQHTLTQLPESIFHVRGSKMCLGGSHQDDVLSELQMSLECLFPASLTDRLIASTYMQAVLP